MIVLADIEELSYKRCRGDGCPIGTVMSRLHRARRAMRERVEAAAGGAPVAGGAPRLQEAASAPAAAPPAVSETDSASEPVSLEAFRRDRRRN